MQGLGTLGGLGDETHCGPCQLEGPAGGRKCQAQRLGQRFGMEQPLGLVAPLIL